MDIFVLTILMGLLLFFLVSFIVKGFKEGISGGTQAIGTSHLPEQFVVFDLETTGLDADKHEIIEIAAIRYTRGGTSHPTFQCLVKPTRNLPKKIVELTGITDEMLEKDGSELRSSVEGFAAFVGGLRLVTFNADFDMAFLQNAATTSGLPQFRNPVSCALKMARRAWPKRKSYRLVDLAKDGQIDEGKAHRALEDARRALIVYSAAVDQLKAVA